MRYRYLDDFERGISVFAIFCYGIAVLGTPNVPFCNFADVCLKSSDCNGRWNFTVVRKICLTSTLATQSRLSGLPYKPL